MKIDRNLIYKLVAEALGEDDKSEFDSLMNLASDTSEGSGVQALEMYEFFDLTEKQIRTLYNVVLYNALEHNIEDLPEVLELRPEEYTDEEMEVHRKMAYEKIVTKSETPERLLKAMNFDFHNEFTKVYGVTPPRSIEFDFKTGSVPGGGGVYHNDGLYLEIPTAGGGIILFTFTMIGDHETVPTDPMIYLRNRKGDEIWMDINSKGGLRYDTDQGETGMSKEEVPDLIRKHMGYATTEPVKEWPELPLGSAAPVKETIDRNYLFQMINEVLEGDVDDGGDFIEKLFSIVASGNLEQAFDLADSLDVEKELFERIVNDKNNNELEYGLTKEIPDETTVEMVKFAIKRPELDDKLKNFLSNTEFTLPTSFNAKKGSYDTVTDFKMYRKAALLVFKNILKRFDRFNALNEENFGRESRGEELLQEGWKDQWPNEFGYLLGKITNSIGDKPDIFAEALVKIFYKVGRLQYLMPIGFLRSLKNTVIMYADKGIQEQKKKVDDLVKGIEYVKNEPAEYYTEEDRDKAIKELQRSLDTEQETLDKFEEFRSLADNPFYFGRERRKEVQKQGRAARAANPNNILPPMRVSNKLIKSLRKQLTKWRDKNVMNTEVYPYVGYALTNFARSIQSQEDSAYEKTFEGDLAILIQFIKGLRGNQEDLGKKLMSIVNKGKDLKETEFIEAINKFVDEGRQIEFVDCKDAGPNDPCVFLRLDNGMFWHSTSVDYCEITQSKMANCGAASDPTGILYNLMSNEGGVNRYYVTLEYSKSKDKVIQVLGKANTLPKEKYWSAITKFFDAVGNPILDKDAFMHMYNDVEDEMTKEELDQKIQEFVEGIGARMVPPPAIDSWKSMREQIRSGYYSNTIENQPFGGPRANLFRAAILHGKDEGNKATMILNIKMIVQTMKGRMNSDPDLFRQERERLSWLVDSGELKKEILDFAVPEKYLDSQREIHLKYSRSSEARASMRKNGSIVIQVSFVFDVRTEPWTEARGEYLVENFNQLTEYTANKLERVGLSAVFAVTPERAAEVYPEEAKRRRDVDDLLTDMGFEEGKKNGLLDSEMVALFDGLKEVHSKLQESKDPEFTEYKKMMLNFDDPQQIIYGVYLFAIEELGIFTNENTHEPYYANPEEILQDEYVFEVDSKQDALRLQEALREFYRPIKREIYIGADWYGGPPRVMMDIEK